MLRRHTCLYLLLYTCVHSFDFVRKWKLLFAKYHNKIKLYALTTRVRAPRAVCFGTATRHDAKYQNICTVSPARHSIANYSGRLFSLRCHRQFAAAEPQREPPPPSRLTDWRTHCALANYIMSCHRCGIFGVGRSVRLAGLTANFAVCVCVCVRVSVVVGESFKSTLVILSSV